MQQTKAIFILIILVLFLILIASNQAKVWGGDAYLPKADLIKGSTPQVYILENGVRHWIPDPETFDHFRFKWQNIKTYSNSVVAGYPLGEDWDKYDDYPEGSLLRGSGSAVYLIELGKRRWIPTPATFEGNNFGWRYIIDIDQDDLENIDQGDNLTLSESNRYPETAILGGPNQNEILDNGRVEFRYTGTNPLGENSELDFETYLAGHDTDWINQGADYTEEYGLEEGGQYTFFVRSKNEQGYYDPSPASVSFQLGVSAYYQKVEISNVNAKESNFTDDYLELRNDGDETINITGWTLSSDTETKTFSKAIKRLKYPFSSGTEVNIELADGDQAVVSMGVSPDGINFLTNKCTGYLDQSDQYDPSLDEHCPDLINSEYDHLSNACQSFINNLSSCEIPDYSDDLVIIIDSECTGFLNETFNYGQCYSDYYQDIDFLEDEWRIFLNMSIDFLDDDNDTIILKDKSGLVVDRYSY